MDSVARRSASIVEPPPEWLDEPDLPPVVIAIPSWNRSDLLRDCVESILGLTTYPRYRVCVFDQGSTDGSRELLRAWGDRVDAILSPDNVGFILANNEIIDRYARWDVVLLNNDTQLLDAGWLDTLVSTAYSATDIGLVGPKLLYPDGRLQEAGSQLFRNGSARAYGKFEDPAHPALNVRRDVDYCSAACVYVKREVLRKTGAFDESFRPCYYEDADLAMKARAAGYRTVFEPSTAVVHREYGTSGKSSAVELMVRNQSIFYRRWQHLLADHPLSLWQLVGDDGRPQALVIGRAAATAPSSGRAVRVRQVIKALSRSCCTAYADLVSEAAARQLHIPDDWSVALFYPGFARAVGSDVLDLGTILGHNRFRWIVFDDPATAANSLPIVRQYGSGSFLVIDAAADPAAENDAYGTVDAVLAASEAQRRMLERRFPHTVVKVFDDTGQVPHGQPRALWPRLLRPWAATLPANLDLGSLLKDLEQNAAVARRR